MKWFITYYLLFFKKDIFGNAWKVSHKNRPLAILSIIIYQIQKNNGKQQSTGNRNNSCMD